MEKKRMHFLDGYKGLLCFMILLGHFWNIYRLISGASPLDSQTLDTISKIATKALITVASFWLYAFMVISGYLLSFSKIRSASDLLTKTVSRFLRLFLPILGACLMIFLLSKTVGFHAADTKEFFKNTWYQKYYRTPFVFKDVFTESWRAMFQGACAFNTPFWVISDMLIASVLMYICKLVDHLLEKKILFLPLLFILCALFLDKQVVTACFAGFLIGYCRDGLEKLTAKFRNFFVIAVVLYGVFLWLKSQKVLPTVFDKVTDYTLIHCFLLIALNRFSIPQRIFSAKPFLWAGKISFGVYAFHWPVICSVGSLVLLAGLRGQWHPIIILGASFVASVAATIVLSVIYHFTVEKGSEVVIGWVRKLGAKLPE